MLRFDGLYISKLPTDYGQIPSYNYLRFYIDGTAIEVTVQGGRNAKVISWFDKSCPSVSKGQYKLQSSDIRFSLRSESGVVDYAGVIVNDELALQWHSHINGASGSDEYQFFPAPTVEADALIRALEDADPDVCCNAAVQAGKERVRPAVLALVKLLYTKGPGSKRIITAAARALGDIGDLRAIQHLEEAAFAHEYSGVIPGFIGLTADGRTIEPYEQDALMDEALREAERKLWKQPAAEPYLAQLGRIKMYTFGDFLQKEKKPSEIFIEPSIQKRPDDKFTLECASEFFANFKNERFAFEGEIGSIFIRGGKARRGQHSYADGAFYPQTLEELEEMERRVGKSAFDHPVGYIHFEFGGNANAPFIEVSPEPKWPRPSIVRRCVLDGRTGIKFDEIV